MTQNVTLPYKAGSQRNSLLNGQAPTPSACLFLVQLGRDGKVSRASSDRDVTLTAKVTVTSGDIKLAGSHDFTVTVKGDPEKVAADKKALQEKVDAAFTYDNIKYSGTDTVADKDGLTADLQMRARARSISTASTTRLSTLRAPMKSRSTVTRARSTSRCPEPSCKHQDCPHGDR
ncbi:MAG: hypothetical protein ACLU0O_08265 [Collinsella sp.]